MAESTGVWLDKETGKVVRKQPARGRLLVAPGKDLDDKRIAELVSRYEDNYETATAPDDTEKAVTTTTATTTQPAPAKRAAKKK